MSWELLILQIIKTSKFDYLGKIIYEELKTNLKQLE